MADDTEKTEEPTPRKLEKTRKEGQYARSQDLSVALLTIAVACVLYFLGASIGRIIISILQEAFVFDSKVILDTKVLPPLFATLASKGLFAITPILFTTLILAFTSAYIVGGVGFSIKGFFPKASKLNPIKGLGRMFGTRSLVELMKGLLKLSLIGSVLCGVLYFYSAEIFTLTSLDLFTATNRGLSILAIGIILLSISLLIIAAIDVPYQIISFKNKLKMSIQEIKDEYKQSEGNPLVKQRIREKQREIAMSSMLEAISEADVIVTNPTHFAVAISYAVGTSESPRVVAKGADLMAKSIRKKAEDSGIYIFEQPQLARALFYTTEINQDIPRLLFEAVAEVIAYVYKLNSFDGNGKKVKKPRVTIPSELNFDEHGKIIDE